MLEEKLFEALERYREINRYGKKLIMEQEVAPPAADTNTTDAGNALGGADTGALGGADETASLSGDTSMPPDTLSGDTGTSELGTEPADNDTEEIDITDLVNMTKSIKKDLDEKGDASDAVMGKMEDVFKKLDDLESKLGEMDEVMNKIDQLGRKVEQMKEPTPEEKLELRSLDSYPFNQTTDEFFNEKMPEMRKTHKNQYVITPDEVQDYSKEAIKDSFNADDDEDDEFEQQ